MEIEVLTVAVGKQVLTITKSHTFVADAQNIYTAFFTFDEEWEGFAKTVIFKNGDLLQFALLDETNRCVIPAGIVKAGYLEIGVQGNKDGQVITTKKADRISIYESGGSMNMIPEPFEQSEFDRLMDELASNRTYFDTKAEEIEADNAQTLASIKLDNATTEESIKQDNVNTLAAVKQDNTDTKTYVDGQLEAIQQIKTDVNSSMEQVQQSVLQAATSAEQAAENATLATNKAKEAQQFAASAEESNTQASQNATAAATSATQAATSATTAAQKVTEATTAANTATQQATTATNKATAAAASAAEATEQATIATEKATELADSVEQVATNKNAITALYNNKADAIVEEETGDIIVLQDSSNLGLQSLTLYGKSTQDGTPTPENPIEIVSVDNPSVNVYGANLLDVKDTTIALLHATRRADGTIKSNVSNAYFSYLRLLNNEAFYLKNGNTYVFSIDGLKADKRMSVVIFGTRTDGTAYKEFNTVDGVGKLLFTVEGFVSINNVELRFGRSNVAYTDTETVYSNFYFGVIDTDYKPYIEPQTITFPYTLRGIPVNSGGNYTDADGQQWVCDTVEVNVDGTGKLVQRCVELTIDDSYIAVSIVSGYRGFVVSFSLPEQMGRRNGFCDKYSIYTLNYSAEKENIVRLGELNETIYFMNNFYYDETLEDKGLANFKAALADNPVKIVTYVTTPTETELTEAEVQAFLALHTNKPYTTIFSDQNGDMTVEYVADTKLYIDNKFTELQNAILSTGGNV